ncbi:MAG: bifunctional phosphoribosylaminoimidazolecarboxamide formyltransferase/IMP cyclohydrolase [Phycisphaerales bacterium]|nr:bifunctional phosphoribosylaminoimidazolecarboxamide formyltransferase/IMP cyclohydrolase [Phycisphaerales bacterium]
MVRVRRALVSVSDKSDLVPFARALVEMGVEIISTGGTAAALRGAGVAVRLIEDVTGLPEMLDGRVKTLHPKVHGGLLARRHLASHQQAMKAHGIEPIDLVCVNLYPFEQTIQKTGVSEAEAIEQIDIGGPSMIRSAAKNHESVCTVTSPNQYDLLMRELQSQDGHTRFAIRRELAAAAFARTAEYDAAISAWFDGRSEKDLPSVLRTTLIQSRELRYGENPHQRAALYRDPAAQEATVVSAPLLAGKPLSYNNILDASAALELVQDLHDLCLNTVATPAKDDLSSQGSARCACAILKHTNPCGAALAADPLRAFAAAYYGDPLAAYGGIVAFSTVVDETTALAMATADRFLEVVIAEAFSDRAIEVLASRWKNVRLLAVGSVRHRVDRPMSLRTVPGGALVQERDTRPTKSSDFVHAAGPAASAETLAEAAFAMTIAKHLKSNAVCITRGHTLLGGGAGQMDRVASCRIAVAKAQAHLETGTGAAHLVAASDAFFPFADGPMLLADSGVKCIAHPGGSKRDEETNALCNARGITCLTTGVRHFRH